MIAADLRRMPNLSPHNAAGIWMKVYLKIDGRIGLLVGGAVDAEGEVLDVTGFSRKRGPRRAARKAHAKSC